MNQKPIAKFVCEQWPEYRIQNLQFQAGVLYTFTEIESEVVRGAHGYGSVIQELPLEFADPPPPITEMPHQGMQTAGSSRLGEDVPIEGVEPAVVKKTHGWYEYDGKNYRANDLPDEVRMLVGD